jgi:hypothetical protein
MNVGPVLRDHRQPSYFDTIPCSRRAILSSQGCGFCVAESFPHELQLPKEQSGLTKSNCRQDDGCNNKPEREPGDGIFGRTPPQSFERIIAMGAIIGFTVGGLYVAILLILAWRWTKPQRLDRERHIKKGSDHS